MLQHKIFVRLVLFGVLYFSYLIAFNYFSIPQNDISTNNHFNENTKNYKQNLLHPEDTICANNEQADAIMQTYIPFQNQQLDTLNSTGRFIVFSAIDVAGMGNRIPTLISCFILALLTNRGFLVHWPAVEESFTAFKGEHIGMVAFEHLFRTPFFMDSTLHPQFYDRVSKETTTIESMESMANVLLCGDFEEVYGDEQFVIIYGWRPFFDLLLKNKLYADRVRELNLTNLIPEISQCLLQPIPEVTDIIARFKQESNIGPHHKIVGVHIRKFSADHGLSDEQELALWDCVRAKYPPPPLPFHPNWSNWNASILYFLASDSYEALIRAPADFRPYIVMVRSTDTSRVTVLGLAHALADIRLLGESIELFGAQGTTFIALVRTMFAVPTQLAAWGAHHAEDVAARARCVPVTNLPCFKWWDVFRNQPNFSLSCFLPKYDIRSKDSYLC